MFARPKSLHAKVLMANAYPCHGCAMEMQTVPMDLTKLHAVSVDDEKLFILHIFWKYFMCVWQEGWGVAMHCKIEFIFKKKIPVFLMQIKLVVPMNLLVPTVVVFRYSICVLDFRANPLGFAYDLHLFLLTFLPVSFFLFSLFLYPEWHL